MYTKSKQRDELNPQVGIYDKKQQLNDDKKGLIIMKTCYGGYCYTHVDDREFNSILSSPITPFLAGIALVVTLAIVASLLS